MATVRMKKGDKYADIFDSPETIKQAQLDGYAIVEEKDAKAGKEAKADKDDAKEDSKDDAKADAPSDAPKTNKRQ